MAQVKGTPNPDTIGVGTASVGGEPATGATSEHDTIAGLAGADSLAGGVGSDDFQFDPSNRLEGNDVIQDFTLPSPTDSAKFDYVAFQSAQVLAADPSLPGADGDAASLSLVDFDASPNWNLGSSAGGSLLIQHPGGSIELAGIPSNAFTSFNGLAPFIKVDGQVWSGPINLTPVPPPAGLTPPSPPPDGAGTTPNPTGAGTAPNPTGAGTAPNPTGAGTAPNPSPAKLPDWFNLLEQDSDGNPGLTLADFVDSPGKLKAAQDALKAIRENPNYNNIPNEDREKLDTLDKILKGDTNAKVESIPSAEDARKDFLEKHPNVTLDNLPDQGNQPDGTINVLNETGTPPDVVAPLPPEPDVVAPLPPEPEPPVVAGKLPPEPEPDVTAPEPPLPVLAPEPPPEPPVYPPASFEAQNELIVLTADPDMLIM